MNYATSRREESGAFVIRFGGKTIADAVKPTARDTDFQTVEIGEIALDPGESTISIRPSSAGGAELMRLRTIELIPDAR